MKELKELKELKKKLPELHVVLHGDTYSTDLIVSFINQIKLITRFF
ncbi:MAG: hypothetical protein JRE58_12850 [Deltaproteobacteria bacterium]|nr:hypothetical protein [Deltaproteobacteria bacterium]